MTTPTTTPAAPITVTPAIDVTGYVDVVLASTDTDTLVSNAIANARAGAWPDWTPREGQTELTLLELTAQMVAEAAYALNALPGYVVEVMLRFYGLSRDPGRRAVATATLTVATSPAPTVVPAGTLLVLDPGLGVTPVTFATDTALTVAAGTTTGTVPVTAQTVGAAVNGVAAGTALAVLSSVPYLERAVLASVVTSGTEPEDGAAFLARGAPRFSRLTDTLTKPEHFTAAALETAGVSRAATYEATNPDGPNPAPGAAAGHVTVAVAGANGAPLSAAEKSALLATLQAGAYVLITVHVVDAIVTAVNVAATVTALRGFTAADVQANVATALAAYLSPDAWAFGATVWRNELIALIDGVVGVDRVVSITTPATDLALSGLAPLADLGTATITVQAS